MYAFTAIYVCLLSFKFGQIYKGTDILRKVIMKMLLTELFGIDWTMSAVGLNIMYDWSTSPVRKKGGSITGIIHAPGWVPSIAAKEIFTRSSSFDTFNATQTIIQVNAFCHRL